MTTTATSTSTATANRHHPVAAIILEGIPSVTGGGAVNSNNISNNDNNNNASSDDDSVDATGGDVLMALPPRFSSSAASVATTQLASDVGSVMGKPKIAKLKSVTWYRNIDTATPLLQLTMQDTKIKRKNKVTLATVRAAPPPCVGQDQDHDESLTSMIVPGHVVKFIHNQPCKGLSTADCMELWNNPPPPQEDGSPSQFASITVADPDGNEVWVKATIYKPRPDMTLEDLGMTVWYWGYLCIKSIEKDSIFKHTALKSRDHIVSINDIVCDDIKDKAFNHLVKELPHEITITVCRRKQRFSGMFS